MYYRRKILLHLIDAFGSQGIEKLRLQKILFLFCQQQEQPSFDFVPYKFGCYSFQANKDLSVMSNHYHILKQSEEKWFLEDNQSAQISLNHKENQIASQLLKQFSACNTSKIIDYVYDKNPYFSINSIRNMTETQKYESEKQNKIIHQKNNTMLFTIGYEGKSIDA